MAYSIDRDAYAAMFGPTVGDRVRLADTDLIIEVEQDFAIYGEECKFGGGKVLRDGMGQCVNSTEEPLELLDGVPPEIVNGLEQMGHRVEVVDRIGGAAHGAEFFAAEGRVRAGGNTWAAGVE